MVKSSLLIFIIIINLNCIAQTPTILWQKSYGGSFYDKAQSIIETIDGDYVIAGNSQSIDYDLNSNLGNFDCWVIRINHTGSIIWKKSFGGGGYDYARSIIQAPNGGFLCVGETNSQNGDITNPYGQEDFWVVKLNENGEIEWKKNYGGSSNEGGYSACVTNDGNYIIAGSSESSLPEILDNHGYNDFWVLKIDINGNEIWQKNYGGSNHDYLKKIKKTSDGGYILTGDSKSSDGNVGGNNGKQDVWTVKINENGIIQWQNNFGGSEDDFSKNVIEDSDGNFIVIGETYSFDLDAVENHSGNGLRDYFVIKLNNLGQKIWSRCYGGESNEYARSIIQSSSDDYIIVGESYSGTGQPTGNHGSADYWLIKINPLNGNLIWQKNFGGTGHDEPNSMLESFDNDLIIAGNAAHPIGNGDVTQNYGDDDFWIVKLSNNECFKSLNLKKQIPYGNLEFTAHENIISDTKIINPTSKVEYNAGKSISLNPGFSTQTGSVFKAKIEGCNN